MHHRNAFYFVPYGQIKVLGPALSLTEDDRLPGIFIRKNLEQKFWFPMLLHTHIRLADFVDGRFVRFDRNMHRVGEIAIYQPEHCFRYGRGKKQGLMGCWTMGKDPLYVLAETNVKHPVRFVEDNILDFAQFEGPPLEVINDASGGPYDEVASSLKSIQLGSKADASIDYNAFKAALWG